MDFRVVSTPHLLYKSFICLFLGVWQCKHTIMWKVSHKGDRQVSILLYFMDTVELLTYGHSINLFSGLFTEIRRIVYLMPIFYLVFPLSPKSFTSNKWPHKTGDPVISYFVFLRNDEWFSRMFIFAASRRPTTRSIRYVWSVIYQFLQNK